MPWRQDITLPAEMAVTNRCITVIIIYRHLSGAEEQWKSSSIPMPRFNGFPFDNDQSEPLHTLLRQDVQKV